VGKDELTLEQYTAIARELLRQSDSHSLLATTLGWNLMARIGNVVELCLNHLKWTGDHLMVVWRL
jgi:hypothetical protein